MTPLERMTAEAFRASYQGKRNRALGLQFEKIITEACEHYRSMGLAYIEKTPEPMRVIGVLDRKRGIFKAVFEKAAQPDFKGTMAGGRAVVFEAKHTETDRRPEECHGPPRSHGSLVLRHRVPGQPLLPCPLGAVEDHERGLWP